MTILFSLCYLDEPGRLERNQKWLDYHLKLKEELGFDKIVLFDNASSRSSLDELPGDLYDGLSLYDAYDREDSIEIYRASTHLPRTGIWEYPYCWRGLDFAKTLAKFGGADKIIFLDTDFYVLTPKLASYIKNLDSGWTTFRSPKYGFPEAAIHILCKDRMDSLIDFPIPYYTYYNGRHMEELLPFTKVLPTTEFKGCRYGETNEPQTADMDYYGQWSPGCPDMIYNKKG